MSNDTTATESQQTKVVLIDPLRRDFVMECLAHVQQIAGAAYEAILFGEDVLFQTQVDLMRLTMREAIRTFREIQEEAKR